jgi:hypothetical protein
MAESDTHLQIHHLPPQQEERQGEGEGWTPDEQAHPIHVHVGDNRLRLFPPNAPLAPPSQHPCSANVSNVCVVPVLGHFLTYFLPIDLWFFDRLRLSYFYLTSSRQGCMILCIFSIIDWSTEEEMSWLLLYFYVWSFGSWLFSSSKTEKHTLRFYLELVLFLLHISLWL